MDTRPWSRLPETWAETSAASVRQHGARVVDYPTPRVRGCEATGDSRPTDPPRDGRYRVAIGAHCPHRSTQFTSPPCQGVTLLYDTQSGAPQDAPVTTAVDGGNIRVMTGR